MTWARRECSDVTENLPIPHNHRQETVTNPTTGSMRLIIGITGLLAGTMRNCVEFAGNSDPRTCELGDGADFCIS